MDRLLSLLAGAGLGAGLMYVLDPELGRRRRAFLRDKASHLEHEAEGAVEVVGKDLRNRVRGLASGGGARALQNPLRGGWSPSGRALMTGLGAGLFAYGLTRHAPTACILGTLGVALAAEGISNVGPGDVRNLAERVAGRARELAGR
jgi:hypothetical protein